MDTADNQPLTTDPELEALLALLRDTPRRDPRVVARGRTKFISDVDQVFSANQMGLSSWLAKIFTFEWLGQNNGQSGSKRPLKLPYFVLLVALLLAIIFFSGMGATAYAAQSALPGDVLYNVKMSIEQTQVRLAADAAKLAELHLEFAERRLNEISGLIAEGHYGEIESATQEFEYHVQQALIAMQTVAAGDPLRAQALAARVTAALSEYAQTLSGMMINVPEDTRASMQRAINTSQNAGNVTPAEINENEDASGIIAPPVNSNGDEQQIDQSNQNGMFSNENENQNGEDNTNLNSNENQDRNENLDNQNDHEDQNSNSNLNDDDGENENKSGDEHDGGSNDNHRDDDDKDNNRDGGDNHNGGGGNDNGGDD